MPLCTDDKSFIVRFDEKSEEEKKGFVEANLPEILDPENRKLIEYWWGYVNSKRHKMLSKVSGEKKFKYWELWDKCLRLACDVSDKRRTSIEIKKSKIEELKLDKEIRDLSETEVEKQERELVKEKKEAEFQLKISSMRKQEEQSGRLSGKKERLEQKKLLDEEEDLVLTGFNRRVKNIIEDPLLEDRERRRLIAEQQDIRDKELAKIEKQRSKLG